MHVLYEDNHLLALNKPADLLTQDSGTTRDSLETQARAWLKERDQKPGNAYLHAVHRLDTGASGIVLFAKTSKALSRLQAMIRAREWEKIYLALVSPPPKKKEATLEHLLQHGKSHAYVSSEGVIAILSYKEIKRKGPTGLLEIDLQTGRYHQIRAQLKAIGSPIVGDHKYGGLAWGESGLALHHHKLTFAHPVTKESLQILAEAPWSI